MDDNVDGLVPAHIYWQAHAEQAEAERDAAYLALVWAVTDPKGGDLAACWAGYEQHAAVIEAARKLVEGE